MDVKTILKLLKMRSIRAFRVFLRLNCPQIRLVHNILNSRQSVRHISSQSSTTPLKPEAQNVDHEEVKNLNNLSLDWWNPTGQLKGLHSMNKLRVPFIRDGIISSGAVDPSLVGTPNVLEGVEILEVGCGGGILTEPLARLHSKVVGLDLGEDLLKVAREHLDETLKNQVEYRQETVEEFARRNISRFDAIVASEVLEHVNDKASFLEACVLALKPGGSIFITTLNKTQISWFGGVFMAENVLKLLPKDTHNWDKFISPDEVEQMLKNFDCTTVLVHGMMYEFWRDNWEWCSRKDINYALHAIKN